MKPNRLQAFLVAGAARIFNPQLATDAKDVHYGKLFTGLTTKNLPKRKTQVVADAKKMLAGKTLAKDATTEGLVHLLDQLEHVKEHESLDESVSPEQHRAMEAAAHGHSNLGIPKNVGKEFEHADKGHSFSDAVPNFLKDKGMSDDDCARVMDMLKDEMPENALDESEEDEEEEAEDEHEEGEDEHEEEAEDESEEEREEKKPAKDRKGGKDAKGGKDTKGKDAKGKDGKAMDSKKFVTVDEMNKALETQAASITKKTQATMEARTFVRPYVGELPMALDSAEKIHRAAAVALGIEDADTVHPSALRTLIKTCAKPLGEDSSDGTQRRTVAEDAALDGEGNDSFTKMFPEGGRIKAVA